jgi:hypothetical protein
MLIDSLMQIRSRLLRASLYKALTTTWLYLVCVLGVASFVLRALCWVIFVARSVLRAL